jgi:hypothetical protein
MDSGRTRGPALQMSMHEVGHEQSATCLVSDRGPRRERYSCSLPAETRRGRSWRWVEGRTERELRESLRRAAEGEEWG